MAVPNLLMEVRSLPRRVLDRAEATPDVPALVSLDEGLSQTWADIQLGALHWADALRRLGVGPGCPLATMIPQSTSAFHVWLALGWIRALEFPINAHYRRTWLKNAIGLSQAKVLVAASKYLPAIEEIAAEMPFLRTVVELHPGTTPEHPRPSLPGMDVISAAELLADSRARAPGRCPEVWDTSCVMSTSGTTGQPKGVIITWGQMDALAAVEPPTDGQQTYYHPYGPFHLTGKSGLLKPARSGGRGVIRESLSVSKFWTDINAQGVTWTVLLPMLAHVLHQSPLTPGDRNNPLQMVLTAPVVPHIDELKERFGFDAFSVYGMTEIGTPLYLGPERCVSSNYKSSGFPVGGIEARIVDDADQEVPDGVDGELVVRSQTPWLLNRGYYGQPELSSQAWRNGWFHTGDCFRRQSTGELEFVDRLKDVIRRRGENISSFEVESVVLSHPDVTECAAIGVPSPLGEDEVMIVVATSHTANLTATELVEFLAPRLPRFAIPRFVRFVPALPRTEATLWIQKKALREVGVTEDTWDREPDQLRQSVLS
jgi:crotonobetaine/carnitine-CoA ligase